MRSLVVVLLMGLPALAACAVSVQTTADSATGLQEGAAVRTHEALNATLWAQTAAEYRASALQAYQAARRSLHRALADTTWTAALEQREQKGYGSLPPAVVLDVDETVLDNSPYQAWLITAGTAYPEGWEAWIEAREAAPVPGALAFTRFADSLGVTVFYLTNRRHHQEAATRDNLERFGFPLRPDLDVLVTRGEREDWASSDKGSRRQALADRYRLLLLVGDNLGDFVSGVDTTLAARSALLDRHAAYWGTRWIVLPNPLYGSWEGAVLGFDYGLPPARRFERKVDALDPAWKD